MKRREQSGWGVALVIAGFFAMAATAHSQVVAINELLASNTATIADEYGEFDDFVEFYNPTGSPVDLAGLYLTDDLLEPTKWQIPTGNSAVTTVPAQGHRIFWFDNQPAQGAHHVGFKLSASGESVTLIAADGVTPIDAITFSQQNPDVSFGRQPDGSSTWKYFATPTPGASNTSQGSGGFVVLDSPSPIGGFYSGSQTVSLSTPEAGATIHYSLDGSVPTTASPAYAGPISIAATTVVRARAFKNGSLPSNILTATYFIGVNHTLAVVSLVTDPPNLWDFEYGIYEMGADAEEAWPHKGANFWEDWERDVHVEFFQPSGAPGFSVDAGTKIFGGFSRGHAQKSQALHFRGQYGANEIDYPIFPDEPITKFKSLVMRNSGNDWSRTHFRDALVHTLIRDMSDIPEIEPSPIKGFAYRPTVLYLNGAYWGVLNMREKGNEDYLASRFGIDPDNVDLLEWKPRQLAIGVIEGDSLEYRQMTDFIDANSMSVDANYEAVADMMDVEEYRDYIGYYIFHGHHDWPANNQKFWREKEPGKKWHWIMYDTDNGYLNPDRNMFLYLDDNPGGRPSDQEANYLFRKLSENAGWRHGLINRISDLMNVALTPDRVLAKMEEMAAVLAPEMPAHTAKWGKPLDWEAEKQFTRDFAPARRPVVEQQIIDFWTDPTGTANLSVAAAPSGYGTVKVSTITPDVSGGAWTGGYFTGVPVPLRAIPARGNVFTEWTDGSLGTEVEAEVTMSEDYGVTARFAKGSTSTAGIVINEINYNSPDAANAGDWVELFNPTGSAVWLSGMYFQDESGKYFPIPSGVTLGAGQFLILAEDLEAFQAVHPGVTAVTGDFGGPDGFKLSNASESIELRNADHVVIDKVTYADGGGWPITPDGDGPTLSLIRFSLDNAQAASWAASDEDGGTPGAENFMGIWANLKVSLQGAWSNGLLQTGASGVIPMTQPYSGAPWNYNGTEQMETVPDGAVDWVLVELRSSLDGPAVATRAALVMSDGRIASTDGAARINFAGMSSGSFYAVVYHRNHLAIVSPTAISLTP